MSELDVILSKINIIRNCLMAIEKASKWEKDEDFRLAIYELNLQRAIQACIDLANIVLSKEGLGLPNSYRQSFELLRKFQVIPAKLANTLVAMVGFRNISVHDYEQIKPEIVHGIVSDHLVDFEAFYGVILERANSWEEGILETEPSPSPIHPWRVCPYGEHWVKTPPMRVPPGKKHPGGFTSTRHENCARNPSGKDELYTDEIQEIAAQHFSGLKNKPCPLDLGFVGKGDKYDDFIAGWVQYWNDVLKPDEPLDPNLIKALIASESRFVPTLLADKTNSNSARGLAQITNDARKLLGGHHNDLKDHLITVTKTDLNDPNVNICAGVRWFFEKRRMASIHLGRPASWIDTVWEYKGLRRVSSKQKAEQIKKIFNGFYKQLQKCGKA